MICKVIIRGAPMEEMVVENPANVGNLRNVVLGALQNRPIQHKGSRIEELPKTQTILIFQNTPVELLENDNMELDSAMQYCVFEKFTTVPVDLYRTVKLSQIHPVVKADIPSPFTEVVPLFCASFQEKESVHPPFRRSLSDLNKSGRTLFSGASLRACDEYREVAENPWDDVTREENKMGHQVDLGTLDGTYRRSTTAEGGPSVGILRSTKLYTTTGAERFNNLQLKEEGKTVKTRNYYWRFKLEQGTDLQAVGMYLVCDKEDGHFCLVPEVDRSHSFLKSRQADPRKWPYQAGERPLLMEPEPGVAIPNPPEALLTHVSGGGPSVVAFPVVAQKFRFNDLVMKASGRPWDMIFNEEDDDEDKKKLGAASNVVFEHSNALPNTHDILDALDVLRTKDFNITSVPFSDCGLLHETMDDLLSAEDTIEEDEIDIVVAGMAIIDKHLKSLGVSPPLLSDIPYESPPLKIARME